MVTLNERELIAIAKAVFAKQKQAKIENRKKELQRQKAAIADGKVTVPQDVFDVIVIDPPWDYERNVYSPTGRRVASPYPSMSQDELLQLKLPVADDCVMFLWTTHGFIFFCKRAAGKVGI